MAGTYPDVPAPKIPYDRLGSTARTINHGLVETELTTSQIISLIDENVSDDVGFYYVINSPVTLELYLPFAHDLTGIFLAWGIRNSSGVQQTASIKTSTDSGGTWTQRDSGLVVPNAVKPQYRGNIYTFSGAPLLGVNAIQITAAQAYNSSTSTLSEFIYALHLYGVPSAGAIADHLAIWDPTLDQEVGGAYFDFGDVVDTGVYTKDFRVKNMSTTKTATNVQASFESLSGSDMSVDGLDISADGGVTYTTSLTIGDLAPSQISSVLTVRRSVSAAHASGVNAGRMKIDAIGLWV